MASTRKNRGRQRIKIGSALGSTNRALARSGTAFKVKGPTKGAMSPTARSLLGARSILPANTAGRYGSSVGVNPRAVPAFRRKRAG